MKEGIFVKESDEIVIAVDKIEYLQRELTNVRDEFSANKYLKEARLVLNAGGLRSTIGCYWNAVVDDLRRKVIHRSVDLFNKEVSPKRKIESYEDFQNFISDYDLIEGAYQIGVIGWEAHKLLHQARETRNIFDGHPESSDPTLFKVFNMISDCNRYVLSQDYPIPIIDVNQYILTMDTDNFYKNEFAVEQAFSDLPEIYKSEMANRIFTIYTGDNSSTRLNSNIEFCFPILWKVISKEIRQQIGKRFDKLIVNGDSVALDKATSLMTFVDGLRYISSASRRVIYEPIIKELEDNLDKWDEETAAVIHLQRLGTTIPSELIERYVSALTLTYVGYKGTSYYSGRTTFYSNGAAPRISEMFEKFDNSSVEAFIDVIRTNDTLQYRIKHASQLNRLRTLGQILLNKPEIRSDLSSFLLILVDTDKTKELLGLIKK